MPIMAHVCHTNPHGQSRVNSTWHDEIRELHGTSTLDMHIFLRLGNYIAVPHVRHAYILSVFMGIISFQIQMK
jgi:hypothetical protein